VVIAPHVPPEYEGKVKEAVLNCPERAITTTG
jgi:ferredoxin